jgi:hypothetical protein
VPRHVARLVVWLVVDYFASRRLAHRASWCVGTTHGSSSITSTTLRVRVPRHVARLVKRLVVLVVVDYFDYAAHLGASAHRVARHAARHRLLRLRRASGCLGTSRGSSRGSSHRTSSTTLTTPRVQVPRHVTRLVTRLVASFVVDYFDYAAPPGASTHHAAHCTARHRLL